MADERRGNLANCRKFMNKIIAMLSGIIFFMGGFLPSFGTAQEIDPFYLQRLESGEHAFNEGNYEAAIEELDIALFGIQAKEQLKAKAFIYLGMSHFYLSNKEKARTYMKDARDILGMDGLRALITEDAVWFYLNRSMIELKLLDPETKQPGDTVIPPGNPAPAKTASTNAIIIERDLEKQIKASPQNASLYYFLYEHHLANDNPKAAKKTIANLIKNNPNEAKGYFLMGKIQYKQRELKAAEKNLQKVFELQNNGTVEEYVLLEAKVYQILTARLRGDKNRAYQMLGVWSNILTKERIRYFDIDEQDRGILQGIFESEEYQQVVSEETLPNADSNSENGIPIDQVDIQPVLKERVDPKYTATAAKRGIKGQVIVNALISETGDVIEVAVVQELPGGLSEEVEKAVMQWKYEPAVKDGQAVKVWKRITVTFKAPQS